MWSLFFKPRKAPVAAATDKRAEQISSAIIERQLRLAGWLQGQSEKLPEKGKKAILLLFVIFGSACCINLMVTATSGGLRTSAFKCLSGSVRLPIKITDINIPGSAGKAEQELKLQKLYNYVDSLAQRSGGIMAVDSLLKSRPSLLDSIQRELQKIK